MIAWCSIFDKWCIFLYVFAGFSFDLSSLKAETFYKLSPEGQSHDYYINVCAPVTGSPCHSEDGKAVGVCQVQRADNS